MERNPDEIVVVTDGQWMHLLTKRAHHRHYPEARAEGRSLPEALKRLAQLLSRGMERVHGAKHEAIKRAVADVDACRPQGV